MLLISLNAYAKDKLLKEVPIEEEEKVSKKKKGKANKKKGEEETKKFDPTDVPRIIIELQQAVEIIDNQQSKIEKLKLWAASLFDDSIINALPLTNAKKKYTKRNFA
jgi:hypothetical protein